MNKLTRNILLMIIPISGNIFAQDCGVTDIEIDAVNSVCKDDPSPQNCFYDTIEYIKTGSSACLKNRSTLKSAPVVVQKAIPAVTAASGFRSRLKPGDFMKLDDMLCSANKKFKLTFQKDGNLCLDKAGPNNQRVFIWCNMKHSYGQNANTRLRMQKDGNLVVYNNDTKGAVWATNKYGPETDDHEAVMQDDGNFVIYKQGKPIWASNTYTNPGPNNSFSDCK